jgi:hypothetical protein
MMNNMTIYYLYQYINKGCDKKIIVRKIIRNKGLTVIICWRKSWKKIFVECEKIIEVIKLRLKHQCKI